jgi:IS5 family transposase
MKPCRGTAPQHFQFFSDKEFFQHAFPCERWGLSHWRKQLSDDR